MGCSAVVKKGRKNGLINEKSKVSAFLKSLGIDIPGETLFFIFFFSGRYTGICS